MMSGYRGGHLREWVDDYVACTLPPDQRAEASRHLICCESCRREVEDARQLNARLRTVAIDPGRAASLMGDLMALPQQADGGEGSPRSVDGLACVAPARVSTLPTNAPPQYTRKPRGPVAGLAALGLVGGILVTSIWASPQRRAPLPPQSPNYAQTMDRSTSVRIVHTHHPSPTPLRGADGTSTPQGH